MLNYYYVIYMLIYIHYQSINAYFNFIRRLNLSSLSISYGYYIRACIYIYLMLIIIIINVLMYVH